MQIVGNENCTNVGGRVTSRMLLAPCREARAGQSLALDTSIPSPSWPVTKRLAPKFPRVVLPFQYLRAIWQTARHSHWQMKLPQSNWNGFHPKFTMQIVPQLVALLPRCPQWPNIGWVGGKVRGGDQGVLVACTSLMHPDPVVCLQWSKLWEGPAGLWRWVSIGWIAGWRIQNSLACPSPGSPLLGSPYFCYLAVHPSPSCCLPHWVWCDRMS